MHLHHDVCFQTNPEPIGDFFFFSYYLNAHNVHMNISEAAICDSPLVRSAVMFGDGRTKNGVILELHKEHAFNPTDVKKLNELRSAIW
jgi:hypothetical protein